MNGEKDGYAAYDQRPGKCNQQERVRKGLVFHSDRAASIHAGHIKK